MIQVELDDFDTIDLISELSNRLSRGAIKRMGVKERSHIMSEIAAMAGSTVILILPLLSVEDQSKKDVVLAAWYKYTSYQLEEKLK